MAAQPADSVAIRVAVPAGTAQLPRLGLRLSAGSDLNTLANRRTGSKFWLASEANRWLGRRLSIGAATGALIPIGRSRDYNYIGIAQGHLTYTLIHERPFSLNVRVGIFGALTRTGQEVFCDLGCGKIPPQFIFGAGLLYGLYPTFLLTDRWSFDAAAEVRPVESSQGFIGLLGLGIKLRLLKPVVATTP